MTRQEAIDYMSKSKNIREWNVNREFIKKALNIVTNKYGQLTSDVKQFVNSPLPIIDRMCGQILKKPYVKNLS